MNQNLKDKINELDIEDKIPFQEIERGILEYGREKFKDNNPDNYFYLYRLILNRNIYSERELNYYLNSLDAVYEIRTQFLDHMHNQNIISILHEENERQSKELIRLQNILGGF